MFCSGFGVNLVAAEISKPGSSPKVPPRSRTARTEGGGDGHLSSGLRVWGLGFKVYRAPTR